MPLVLVVFFGQLQLAGRQGKDLRLSISFDGHRNLIRRAEILKNFHCLLRIGQRRTVDILDQVARTQSESGEGPAITAGIHPITLLLAGDEVRRGSDDVGELGRILGQSVLNAG